jgi:phosphatidylcholine synthase
VFVWFIAATVVDAIDGPLARLADTKRYAGDVSGRTIDDIVDYIGFTFLPLALVWRMDWVPGVVGTVVVVLAMMASLIGFAHAHAKDEERGFFRGFPSYFNIVALYFGLSVASLPEAGPWLNVAILLGLTVMTVSPVWLIYPNLCPRPWKPVVLIGSYIWGAGLVAMLPWYPSGVPGWIVLISLIYPLFYLALSLSMRDRWPGRNITEPDPQSP